MCGDTYLYFGGVNFIDEKQATNSLQRLVACFLFKSIIVYLFGHTVGVVFAWKNMQNNSNHNSWILKK